MIANEFNKIAPYHINNPEVLVQLYASGLEASEFITRLEHVVKPVYDSAKVQGFKEWICDEKSSI